MSSLTVVRVCLRLKVSEISSSSGRTRLCVETVLIIDPEVEELEIGGQEDLAADVDDGAGESDEEALDTDDEIEGVEIEEESDSESHSPAFLFDSPAHQQHLCTSSRSTRYSPTTNRCSYSNHHLKVTDSSLSRPTLPKRHSRYPGYGMWSTAAEPKNGITTHLLACSLFKSLGSPKPRHRNVQAERDVQAPATVIAFIRVLYSRIISRNSVNPRY